MRQLYQNETYLFTLHLSMIVWIGSGNWQND